MTRYAVLRAVGGGRLQLLGIFTDPARAREAYSRAAAESPPAAGPVLLVAILRDSLSEALCRELVCRGEGEGCVERCLEEYERQLEALSRE